MSRIYITHSTEKTGSNTHLSNDFLSTRIMIGSKENPQVALRTKVLFVKEGVYTIDIFLPNFHMDFTIFLPKESK